MEFGQANGMAVDLGFDQRINDLRYHQQQLRQQEALNESKRKLFESDIEYTNGGNAFDQPLVKAENEKITQQLGNYIASNPDWELNFQKRGIVNNMKRSLKDNPTVLRALTTNDNRKALMQYAQEAKQKGVPFDEDALNNELNRYSNYEKFGNPDGPDAVGAEGHKAYLFTRPKDWTDMNNVYKEAGASIKNPAIIETGNGGYYTKPKDADVEARANSILQQYGNQLIKQHAKQGITDPNQIKNIVKQNILASFDSDFKLGDSLKAWELGMKKKEMDIKAKEAASKAGSGNYSQWHYFVDEKKNPAGVIPKEVFDKVWGGVSPQYVKGNDGFKADMSGMDFKTTGRYVNTKGGTFINGYIDMTPEEATQRGIYKMGKFTIDEVKPNFTGIAKETKITDKDGNDHTVIRVNYDMPINRDDENAMSRFNIATDVDKLVPAINPGQPSFYGQRQPKQVVQNGITYTFNENTGQYE